MGARCTEDIESFFHFGDGRRSHLDGESGMIWSNVTAVTDKHHSKFRESEESVAYLTWAMALALRIRCEYVEGRSSRIHLILEVFRNLNLRGTH